jgi:hypothetical protein
MSSFVNNIKTIEAELTLLDQNGTDQRTFIITHIKTDFKDFSKITLTATIL